MFRTLHFLSKLYNWRALERTTLDEPFFVLTGDIDSTVLSDEQFLLLEANLQVAKQFKFPYWIFLTSDPLDSLPGLCERIFKLNNNVIIGSHGFRHIHFSRLNYTQQTEQLRRSSEALTEALGKRPVAVRTPYLSTNRHTYNAIADFGFDLDFSTSFGLWATRSLSFLRPRRLKKTIFIPLTTPSDTYFRKRNLSWRKMSAFWIEKADIILNKGGVISFLVHPGARYEETPLALEALLKHIRERPLKVLGANRVRFKA